MEESRYSRQNLLFGNELQKKIENACVGIVGLGALGSNSAEALARMGFRKLIIIDRDIVEEHNLHRTALYEESDIGLPKDYAARKKLEKINSRINVDSYSADIMISDLSILDSCDIILDCLDNMNARRTLNEYCLKNNKDWIYSSAIKNYGEAKVFIHKKECYECLYQDKETAERCTTHGVNPAIIRAVSAIQISELVKYLSKRTGNENKSIAKSNTYRSNDNNNNKDNNEHNSDYSLMRLNLDNNTLISLKVDKRKKCVCSTGNFREYGPEQKCGNNLWQFRFKKENYEKIIKRNKAMTSVTTDEFVKIGNATIFRNGRMLIRDEEGIAKKTFEMLTGFVSD